MTYDDRKQMADRIKTKREALHYTQEQFAEIIEISLSSYSKIENAFQNPAVNTLVKIAINLNLSLDYIVFGEKNAEIEAVTDVDLINALINFADRDKLKHASEVLTKLSEICE